VIVYFLSPSFESRNATGEGVCVFFVTPSSSRSPHPNDTRCHFPVSSQNQSRPAETNGPDLTPYDVGLHPQTLPSRLGRVPDPPSRSTSPLEPHRLSAKALAVCQWDFTWCCGLVSSSFSPFTPQSWLLVCVGLPTV
jgi:hypothetical protein